jgi:hypothetical protein
MPETKNKTKYKTVSIFTEDFDALGLLSWYYKVEKKDLLHKLIDAEKTKLLREIMKNQKVTVEHHTQSIPIQGELAKKEGS